MIILVATIVIASGIVGYLYTNSHQSTQTSTITPTTQPGTSVPTSNTGLQVTSRPRGSSSGEGKGFELNSSIREACKDVGNGNSIGQNIKWLFDHHSDFKFVLHEYPENKTIIWIIAGPNKEAIKTLAAHIEQMECVIEHGGNPRPFDPLFKVDAIISSKYVHTEIKWINSTAIEVKKTADNNCAWQVIKLHAEVVQGFFTTGRIEAQKTHEIPQDALNVCKPYLEGTT